MLHRAEDERVPNPRDAFIKPVNYRRTGRFPIRIRSQSPWLGIVLGVEEGVEFVHKPIIKRRKVFEAIWTGFLQLFKKEDLCTRI